MNRIEKIERKLNEAYTFVESLGFKVWVINLYGSQNYNMDTPNSDYDFKAIVFPTLDDIINVNEPISKVCDFEGGQIDIKDVRLMFENYKKQNVNFIETLFTPFFICNSKYLSEWLDIRTLANRIAYADPKRSINAMVGMAMEKHHALCHPYKSKVQLLIERGYDAKQLSHEYRLKIMLEKFVNGISYKDILMPNEYERTYLMNIKTYQPQLHIEEAKEMAKRCVDEMVDFKSKLFIENEYTVDQEVYDIMDNIKAQVMKKVFKEALLNEE